MSSKNQDDKNQEKPESSDNASKDSHTNIQSDTHQAVSDEKKRKHKSLEDDTSELGVAKKPAPSKKLIEKGTKGIGQEDHPEGEPVACGDDENVKKSEPISVITISDDSDNNELELGVAKKPAPSKKLIEKGTKGIQQEDHPEGEPVACGGDKNVKRSEPISVITISDDSDNNELENSEDSAKDEDSDRADVSCTAKQDVNEDENILAKAVLTILDTFEVILVSRESKSEAKTKAHIDSFKKAFLEKTHSEALEMAQNFIQKKVLDLSSAENDENADLVSKYLEMRDAVVDDFEVLIEACFLASYIGCPELPFLETFAFRGFSTISDRNSVVDDTSEISGDDDGAKRILGRFKKRTNSDTNQGVLEKAEKVQTLWFKLYEPMIQDDLPPAAAQSRPEPNPPVDQPFHPGTGMFVMTDVFNNDLKNFRQMILHYAPGVFKEKVVESVTAHCEKVKVLLGTLTEQEMVETARGFMRKRADKLIALESRELRIVMLAMLYEHLLEHDLDMRKYVNICYVAGFYGRPEFDTIEKKVMRTDR